MQMMVKQVIGPAHPRVALERECRLDDPHLLSFTVPVYTASYG
jgi:hypothetical protein